MRCWRCNQHDTQVGQMFCDECRGVHRQQEEEARQKADTKQRRKPDSFTHLYFCRVCGAEVYRREHVRVKTKKLMHDIEKRARLALFSHMERVGHQRAALDGELRINERYGDDGFEVSATEKKGPAHTQASHVLRSLGWKI